MHQKQKAYLFPLIDWQKDLECITLPTPLSWKNMHHKAGFAIRKRYTIVE